MKLPLIDEFLRSLEGFQDELTGLLSREAFRVNYAAMLGGTATVGSCFSGPIQHRGEPGR